MPLDIGLRSWRALSIGGVTYFVGYAAETSSFACTRVQTNSLKCVPFATGSLLSTIVEGTEAVPGLTCDSGGTLVVDVPIDEVGGARVFVSRDRAETWTEATT